MHGNARLACGWTAVAIVGAVFACGGGTRGGGGAADSGAPDAYDRDADSDAGVAGPFDATPDGADAMDAPGALDFALQFDGATGARYIVVPDEALFNLTSAFTMEAWVKVAAPAAEEASTSKGSLFVQPYGTSGQYTTGVWFQGGSVFARVELGPDGADTFAWPESAAWHHVAWTYDSIRRLESLYVDGADVDDRPTNSALPVYGGQSLLIGADVGAGALTDGFSGTIDEVRIFSTARSPCQIAADMARSSPLSDPTLVAYYPFDEGFGSVVHDVSPNQYDGELGDGQNVGATSPVWVPSTAPIGAPSTTVCDAGTIAPLHGALQFDPTSQVAYVSIPDNPPKIESHSISLTYEAWIAVNGDTSGTMTVLAKPATSNGLQDSIDLWIQSGVLYAGVAVNGTTGMASAPWTAPNGSWHHIAFVYDLTVHVVTLYLDGAPSPVVQKAATLPQYDPTSFLIGADMRGDGYSLGFQGLIADVRIFSEARDAGTIAQDQAGVSPVGDPALLAFYPLDEGAGVVAHDQSGVGATLDGTLGGGGGAVPVWVVSNIPFQ